MFGVLFTWVTDETAFAIWMNFLNKALGQQFLQYFFYPPNENSQSELLEIEMKCITYLSVTPLALLIPLRLSQGGSGAYLTVQETREWGC